MIKYEDIKKANETIMTTNIKGKDYAEVNQRIKAFRMLYPTGLIDTKIEMLQDGVCVMVAQVGYYGDDGCINWLGKGTAYEKENSTFINKTSYIENCETSAVGRALGMAGFGIDTSVASAEEVQNAIANQKRKEKTTFDLQDEMQKLMNELEAKDESFSREVVYEKYGDPTIYTIEQYQEIIKTLKIKLGDK